MTSPHSILRVTTLAAVTAMTVALVGCDNDDDTLTELKPLNIKRLATAPLGTELTGLELTKKGDLFFNIQHPADANAAPLNLASVGVVEGVDFNAVGEFTELAVPATDAEKQSVLTAVGSYKILTQEGDTVNDTVTNGIGAIYTANNSTKIKQSNDPDFNAFIPTNGDNTAGFLFSAWEDRPGGMSRISINKNSAGSWTVSEGMMVDFSSVHGTWVNCFGTTSPWGSPLSAEELYFDNTADWNNPNYQYISSNDDLATYLGGVYPNPYNYGYIVEIINPAGIPVPVKHFTMGRYSHENAVVMPDNKTVYLSDDGTGTVLFKFVADEAGKLSSGTLYAAKVTQDAGVKDPTKAGFDIAWVELAHASNANIVTWIQDYNSIDKSDYVEGQNSYITNQQITDWAAGKAADNRVAFLETRKAAAAKGATAEFRKMEGININYDGAKDGSVPFMYLAMSAVEKTMSDDAGDIQLDENKCGVVYGMKLESDFNVKRMEPVLAGGVYNSNNASNPCPTDAISNPDNLLVLKDGRVIVGEDTNKHENNMLWMATPK